MLYKTMKEQRKVVANPIPMENVSALKAELAGLGNKEIGARLHKVLESKGRESIEEIVTVLRGCAIQFGT